MVDEKISDHDILGGPVEVSHEETIGFDALTPEGAAIEKALVRRIDLLIMPLIILVYLMNYIDRNNYAAARLQGLEKDLHLHGNQYQVGLSVLFVGYILGQVPSNLVMNHIGRPSLYLGFWVTVWGLVSCLTSQVKSFGGIVACRFVLGFVESPFFAGVLFYISKWYTKKEIAFRMAIFYSGSLLAGAFGNLIAAGILSGLSGSRGLAAWQWLYIIEGSITMVIGLIICAVLPDFPHTWSRLPPEMKQVANRRMAIDAAEADTDDAGGMSQLHGLKLAFTDSKTYMLALSHMCINGSQGFQNFFPTLVETLGYNHIISLLLVAPPYGFMVCYNLGHCVSSDRVQNRFWFYMYPIPIAIVGWIIFMTTDSFGPRYFSFFLMVFVYAQAPTLYAWISTSIPRPPAKRAAAYAFMNAIGNSASIWTPYTYRDQDKPHYVLALSICVGLQVTAGLIGLWLRWKLSRQNKELERAEDDDRQLTQQDLARLEKTAEAEGIDVAAARRMEKSYRYML